MDHKAINEAIRDAKTVTLENCCGQRFIAAGMSDKEIAAYGVPGNALGAYLDGSRSLEDTVSRIEGGLKMYLAE